MKHEVSKTIEFYIPAKTNSFIYLVYRDNIGIAVAISFLYVYKLKFGFSGFDAAMLDFPFPIWSHITQ